MYLLPALPALAVLTALVYREWAASVHPKRLLATTHAASRISLWIFILTALGLFAVGTGLRFSLYGLFLGLAALAFGVISVRQARAEPPSVQTVTCCSSLLVSLYVIAIVLLTPYIDQHRSGEDILADVSGMGIRRVGVLSRNSYSYMWTAMAWRNELPSKVKVKYISEGKLPTCKLRYLLVKSGNPHFTGRLAEAYAAVVKRGPWVLYRRRGVSTPAISNMAGTSLE